MLFLLGPTYLTSPIFGIWDYVLIPPSCSFSRSVSIRHAIPVEHALHSIHGRLPSTPLYIALKLLEVDRLINSWLTNTLDKFDSDHLGHCQGHVSEPPFPHLKLGIFLRLLQDAGER